MTEHIHPTALVSESAQIGADTTIGAYSIIGPHVCIGAHCTIHPHVVIEGRTTLGDGNEVFQFASLGSNPQDLKYHGEPSELRIGSRNIIREYVTLQPGTEGGGMLTSIGDNNLFMVSSHVGHDSHIGDGNILANSVGISGHVMIGNKVTIGGLVGIHQFVRLGDFSFLAGGAMVSQDIPPYCLAHGNRAELIGLNHIGLKRAGWDSDTIAVMRRVYRKIFLGSGVLQQKLQRAREEFGTELFVAPFLDFIASSERGV
ncbi:MAG: acyl-ACP--UDP-N-acetylglucosamine O-acyltransferase, partial [Bdellovibrionales bacterium]|nr:acyl-ACP--UDP-N-acetylglucosamine O-acyltransferase [Bdellovibrionales bacterium]